MSSGVFSIGARIVRMSGERALGLYVQKRISEWLEGEPGRTATELARLSDLSKGQISNLINYGTNAGPETVRKLAPHFGMTEGELYDAARAWAKTRPADPLPARTAAIEWAADEYAPEVIHYVANLSVTPAHRAMTKVEWIARLNYWQSNQTELAEMRKSPQTGEMSVTKRRKSG